MPRARWLKPEFFRDRLIGSLGMCTALVYQALWVWADDGGVVLCDADRLCGEVFLVWPEITEAEVVVALDKLESANRIRRYKVGQDSFAELLTFHEHQKVHKPSRFRYPRPDERVSDPPRRDLGGSASLVPHYSGTGEALVATLPPPRHLDTKTPRHPDGGVAGRSEPNYTTRCVIALNAGMQGNPRTAPAFGEVAASTQTGIVSWETDGIPVAVAEDVITRLCANYTPKPNGTKVIKSLKYFDGAVREQWATLRAQGPEVAGAENPVRAAMLRKQGY